MGLVFTGKSNKYDVKAGHETLVSTSFGLNSYKISYMPATIMIIWSNSFVNSLICVCTAHWKSPYLAPIIVRYDIFKCKQKLFICLEENLERSFCK